MSVDEDDFKFGLVFDLEYTDKLLTLADYYDLEPHAMLRLAIDKMVSVMMQIREVESG